MKGCFATCRAPLAIALLIAGLAQATAIAPGFAQEVHLSGFLDISFGSTKAEAQDAMLRHEGVMLDPIHSDENNLIYAISFGKGHFAALWTFSDGKNENAISISIDKDLYIPIVFQSGRLIELALARQHQATTTGP